MESPGTPPARHPTLSDVDSFSFTLSDDGNGITTGRAPVTASEAVVLEKRNVENDLEMHSAHGGGPPPARQAEESLDGESWIQTGSDVAATTVDSEELQQPLTAGTLPGDSRVPDSAPGGPPQPPIRALSPPNSPRSWQETSDGVDLLAPLAEPACPSTEAEAVHLTPSSLAPPEKHDDSIHPHPCLVSSPSQSHSQPEASPASALESTLS